MNTTKIEWADAVWNPVTGCTKASEGCRNCYAETIAKRFWGERKFTDVQTHPDRLDAPLHWKKPRRVFVNSMSDLFHLNVRFSFVESVFETIEATPRHTYMILTKRPDRMYDFIVNWKKGIALPNVWLGVSVENQQAADERIPILLQTPAAVRFVSVEPIRGPVDFRLKDGSYMTDALTGCMITAAEPIQGNALDWVICGGETGPGARPMHPDWARSLRDQCQAADVPFFFKSWGEWWPAESGRLYDIENTRTVMWSDGQDMLRIGKKAAGRLLDGVVWNQFPHKEE